MSGKAAARSGFVKTSYANDTMSSDSGSTTTTTAKPSKHAAKDKNLGDRCDKTKHATLPADCKTTGARDAGAVNSTQGESGGGSAAAGGSAGAGGAAGAGAAGSAGSSK
ncbi:MAG TPA: hypothetical protein VFO24_12065 [Usitatibacter sp.]|nr:hypothetical protein [Usitatibacter sp.]